MILKLMVKVNTRILCTLQPDASQHLMEMLTLGAGRGLPEVSHNLRMASVANMVIISP